MARVGFKMRLKRGNETEYEKRHVEIWPELQMLLQNTGIRNYTIFRDDLTLFAYLEIDEPVNLDDLPKNEVMKKWWSYNEPLMECNTDASPVVTILNEVFHQD